MDKFKVQLADHAIDDLLDIPVKLRDNIHQNIEALPCAPFPSGSFIKRPKSYILPIYRLRSGDFRILYQILGNAVTILRVIERKLLERVLKRIKS
jgi:mRNA-degrading endonuclease RelE of RelBE toxin-antitoxin system